MSVEVFEDRVPAEWTECLAEFERSFFYPLGPGRRFRISHGGDALGFFRAIGPAARFVDRRGGELAGTIAAARRAVVGPDGSETASAYFGDLKVAPGARGGGTLARLLKSARDWASTGASAGYCVVMEGTSAVPDRYTGRLGLPALRPLAEIALFRLESAPPQAAGSPAPRATDAAAHFARLSRGAFAPRTGAAALRSELEPSWLALADGAACGLLEDTRRVKRLWLDSGSELASAHLSCFAYDSASSAAEMLRRAAAACPLPGLFAAVPQSDAPAVERALAGARFTVARAAVYGAGFPAGGRWLINTSEI